MDSCFPQLARDWPDKSSENAEHPAVWHMLDVGGCAERLLEEHRPHPAVRPPFTRDALGAPEQFRDLVPAQPVLVGFEHSQQFRSRPFP